MKQRIQLSDHFTLSRLLRFTLPSIVMMVFTSAYSVVDGLFVANLVGERALSSINIVYPLFTVIGAFGFMLGTGGSAQVARTLGEGGVAAITAILYLGFIFIAILIGFSIGVAPVIGYHFGARNRDELHGVFKKCMYVVAVVSVCMVLLAELVSVPLIAIFLGNGNETADMAIHGFRLYALSFLLTGFNIFASAFFTSLCDGKVSALISFLRTLLLQVIILVALPFAIGLDGVWLAAPLTELLAAIVSVAFIVAKRKKYGY